MAEIGVEITAKDETKPGVAAAKKSLGGLKTAAKGIGTAAAAAGVGVAAAVVKVGASAVNISKDTQAASKAIEAQLETTADEAERLAEVARGVWANNWAENIEEASAAVIELSKSVDGVAGSEQALVEAAFSISDAFDEPIEDVIKAVGTLTDEFDDLDPSEALDLIAAGFQKGLNKSDDFLDSIGEYSNLFADGGSSATEFFGILESGQASGVLGTDKIADAFKEFQIRVKEDAKGVAGALDLIGLSSADIGKGLADGSVDMVEVFDQVIAKTNELENPLHQNTVLTGLFGTQAEDLGNKLLEATTAGVTGFQDVQGASEELGVQYETIGSQLEGVWRQVLVELTPFTDQLVAMANEYLPVIAAWISENMPKIIQWFADAYEGAKPFITTFATGAETIFDWLKSLWAWLSQNEAAMIAVFAAIGAAIVLALGPVAGATLAIAALVAAVGLIKENWDTITGYFETLWNTVNQKFTDSWTSIKDNALQPLIDMWGTIKESWDEVSGYFTELWEAVQTTFHDSWRAIAENTLQPFTDAVASVTLVWSGISQWFVDLWNNIGTTFAAAWKGITDLLFPEPSYAQQIMNVWGGIVDSIKSIFKTGANSAIDILNQLVNLMNTALKKWNELKFSIKGFSIELPSKTVLGKKIGGGTLGWDGISIETPNIPLVSTIPKFAEGGIVTEPTLGIVGEAGPEAVVPLDQYRGGGARPIVVNVRVEGNVTTERRLKDVIISAVNEAKVDGAIA